MPAPKTNTGPSTGSFRSAIPSPSFPAAPNRYHLYVGLFCPFAHRVLLTRHLKGLAPYLPLCIVRPYPKDGGGWRFPSAKPSSAAKFSDSLTQYPGQFDEYPGATKDEYYGSSFLHEVYFRADKAYPGKYSVPLLWDREGDTAVNNESEDIMRMLNHGFDELIGEEDQRRKLDFYPEHLRGRIDEVNAWLMPELNTGVYKTGFAPDQETYEENVKMVFRALDRLEAMLAKHNKPYILGDDLTELDIKAYATLVRFDAVYVQHFKCNVRMIRQMPVLNRYLKNLHWKEGWVETCDFKHIKENYTKSHGDVNPKGITPLGPIPEVEEWTGEDEAWRRAWEEGRGK